MSVTISVFLLISYDLWMEDDSVRETALTNIASSIVDRYIHLATVFRATLVVGDDDGAAYGGGYDDDAACGGGNGGDGAAGGDDDDNDGGGGADSGRTSSRCENSVLNFSPLKITITD